MHIIRLIITFLAITLIVPPFYDTALADTAVGESADYYTTKADPEKEVRRNVEISEDNTSASESNEGPVESWPDRSEENASPPQGGEKDGASSVIARREAPKQSNEEPKKETDHKEKLKQNVSTSFKDMDLKQALSILAETYDLNIMAGDEVKGNVTINFNNVPLEDVLSQMLKLKNFTYKWEGSIIKVISAEEVIETRIYHLNYITLDLAKEVIADKISKDGKVKLNTATNQLIITDTAGKHDSIKKTLEDMDVPPAQVRIESKLIDISHTDLDNLGVKWETSTLTQPMSFLDRIIGRDQKTKMTQADYTNNTGSSSDLTASQFVIAFSQGSSTVTATIDALIRARKVKIIANPSITTINNVEAKINIGEKYPIKEQTQTSTGTLETVRFVDIGTTLKVTPKINHDNTIQLTIHPEVSSVASTITDGPRITTREADTTVIVRDGETLIIAGLLSTSDNLTKTKIPVLGYIPIIGTIFSSQDKDKEQKELVIFMTPHILNRADKGSYTVKAGIPSETEQAAERINMMEYFAKAEDLERGESLQTKIFPIQVRLAEAAQNYERVAILYPANYFAELSLYRAGQIYEYKLKDYQAALSCYRKLADNYPKSIYLASAKNRIKKVEKRVGKK